MAQVAAQATPAARSVFRDDHLRGRVALVTGAAGAGIGQATARRLAAAGATVVVSDSHQRRTDEVTAALQAEHGPDRVVGHVLDCGSRSDIDRVVHAVAHDVSPVDILVNNAAINVLGPTHEIDPLDWDRVLEVDLSGPWYLSRTVLAAMVAARRGAIVNVTSVAAYLGAAGEAPYAAAKAALHSLTRTIASEAGPAGVRCNAVAPGFVHSRFMERHADRFASEAQRVPLRRFAEPDEVAHVIEFLVSDAASYVTGEIVNVSGGWYLRP